MTESPAPWQNVAARLRPFIARRVSPAEHEVHVSRFANLEWEKPKPPEPGRPSRVRRDEVVSLSALDDVVV